MLMRPIWLRKKLLRGQLQEQLSREGWNPEYKQRVVYFDCSRQQKIWWYLSSPVTGRKKAIEHPENVKKYLIGASKRTVTV